MLEVEVFDESTAHMMGPIMRNVVTHRRAPAGKPMPLVMLSVARQEHREEQGRGYDHKVNITSFAGIFPPMTPDMLSW